MPVYFLGEDLLFPDPENADDSGLLAVGGDLSTQRLLLAYRCGIFPWFSEEDPILWFSPDPRLVIFPNEYAASKSLLKELKSDKFKVRFDSDFRTVIENCSNVKRKNQTGTWITNDMKEAYIELYEKGYAHSVESYKDGKLVGGLYGVSIGRAFFGESMFHTYTNASKVAFHYLVDFINKWNFEFIDCQVTTNHMMSLGGRNIRRNEFLELLDNAIFNKSLTGNWGLLI